MNVALARQAADAVLYEGYLLYPYRATARKNQVRWQFGVLGPPGAASAGAGEEADLAVQCLLASRPREEGASLTSVSVQLRFLQLQRRTVERGTAASGYVPAAELTVGDQSWTSWDEAVEVERDLGTFEESQGCDGSTITVHVDEAEIVEPLPGGRLVRRRWPLDAEVRLSADRVDGFTRLSIAVRNTGETTTDPDSAIRSSLIGTHLILQAEVGEFISVIDPPDAARTAAAQCVQHRCWPVLAGVGSPDSQSSDVVLAAPIILYDHPAVAAESAGAMFDSTEIDEILTLRVMTLTDDEKAQARATDAAAAAIIDRCDQMTPEQLQQLHGVMRDPHARRSAVNGGIGPSAPAGELFSAETPWWDPAADASVDPSADVVIIEGMRVTRGSEVVIRPRRRADAQDIFFAGQLARVTSVHFDVDGETHVGVVLANDPAADLHEWYGRSLYFAPDELQPLAVGSGQQVERTQREG